MAKQSAKPEKTTPPNPTGRPTTYSDEIAARILAGISDGKSLRTVCKQTGMPAQSTIYLWLAKHPSFSERYTHACEERAEAIFEDTIEIADDSAGDFTDTEKGPVFNGEHVQRARLRVDTRKWFVAKLYPKKYGERITQEHLGDGGGPVRFILDGRDVTPAKK